MQTWVVYGLLAAIFFGGYAIAAKIAISEKYFGINPFFVSLLVLVGIAISFVFGILYEKEFKIPKFSNGIFFGIFSGILWGLGAFLSFKALKEGMDVARLTPIYNINTLVAVLLGIILLHELPVKSEMIRVIIGALLIVVGSILVSF